MESSAQLQIAPHEYNQWQRTKTSSIKGQADSSSEEDVPFVIGHVQKHPEKVPTARSCRRHSCVDDHRASSGVPKVEGDVQKERDVLKELKVLNLLIKARKKALQSYLAREQALLEENSQMQEDIEHHEKEVHGEVTSLLQKYEHYRGAVTTLTSKFDDEKAQAEEELRSVLSLTEHEIAVLNQQVQVVDAGLKAKREELSMLLSYKDREYPVRAMRISQLQKRIDALRKQHKRQLSELQSMVVSEKDQYHRQLDGNVQGMKEEAADSVMGGLHNEIEEMAIQNITMRKEIRDHLAEKSSTEGVIPMLQREIAALKIDPRTDIRKQMFPHLYQEFTKCTPDMDVVLDIPTYQEVIL